MGIGLRDLHEEVYGVAFVIWTFLLEKCVFSFFFALFEEMKSNVVNEADV